MVAIYYSTQMADDSCPFRICDLNASCLLIFLKHKQILIFLLKYVICQSKKGEERLECFWGLNLYVLTVYQGVTCSAYKGSCISDATLQVHALY